MSAPSQERVIKAAKRLLAARESADDMLKFMRFIRPDPQDIDDPDFSRYEITPLARLLTQIMQKVYRGEMKRVAVSVGPQMGKSEVISRGFPAWLSGKNPYANLILGTFNQPKADEEGDHVRSIMNTGPYRQVFPQSELRKGGAAKNLLITVKGGRQAFVGRGGSGTGRPADYFIVDDPLKDDVEAQSDTTREETWKWFNRVALTRCHSRSSIVVVHTRWHTDDLIGRLCDPDHPERNKLYKGIADRWEYINLPAVVEDPKLASALGLTLEPPTDPNVVSMFGTKPMTSLWPGRKDLDILAEAKQMDPAGFSALYMGKPTPDDGDYFKLPWLIEYDETELPRNLTVYGASDHAVSTKQDRDYTVLGCVGVDEEDTIWVLPGLVKDRMQTDRTVEEILMQMKLHQPVYWWMESEMISKSFGPFLQKRMIEDDVYVPIDEVTVSKDKATRARAIQGRMAMKKVRFPRFAPWWQEAKQELLRFPNGANDDFVDFMSHVGMGLVKQLRPSPVVSKDASNVIRTGSIEWILRRAKVQAEREKQDKAASGW
jgi:predicted phage terminase large subunit-like protein